eukprot:CAMPEP_0198559664 /NCGR_PEP_ID=MMETSP1462-20131121/92762_1 /TAXON_ID=1333877 /ORGANISM="Brandtodinium nutriculum, Strain RCC3387" /LENGTH=62 /DNA_ID=CAMNT_0044290515 /DNA_START=76 /DNA_END=261 /DNA_ORIENTATION=-
MKDQTVVIIKDETTSTKVLTDGKKNNRIAATRQSTVTTVTKSRPENGMYVPRATGVAATPGD